MYRKENKQMGIFKNGRHTGWWVRSKSDKKWNCKGKSIILDKGSPNISFECPTVIEELKKLYGEPPRDLKFGYSR